MMFFVVMLNYDLTPFNYSDPLSGSLTPIPIKILALQQFILIIHIHVRTKWQRCPPFRVSVNWKLKCLPYLTIHFRI